MTNTSPSSIFGFGCSLHKDTCDILSECFISNRLQEYSSKKYWNELRYTNKFKSKHGIGNPKKGIISIVAKKQVLMLELCLLNNILHYQY